MKIEQQLQSQDTDASFGSSNADTPLLPLPLRSIARSLSPKNQSSADEQAVIRGSNYDYGAVQNAVARRKHPSIHAQDDPFDQQCDDEQREFMRLYKTLNEEEKKHTPICSKWKDFVPGGKHGHCTHFNNDRYLRLVFGMYGLNIEKFGNEHWIGELKRLARDSDNYRLIHKLNHDEVLVKQPKPDTDDVEAPRTPFEPADGETRLYSVKNADYKSTNDLLGCNNIPKLYTAAAILVLLLQIFLLALVIESNLQNDTVHATTVPLVVVRLFIAMYLSMTLANSLSDTMFVICSQCVWEAKEKLGDGHLVFIPTMIYFLWRLIVSSLGSLRGSGYWGTKGVVLVVAESLLIGIMIVSTTLITKQQNSILDSVFNFVGLLLILDFDELVAKFFPLRICEVTFMGAIRLRRDERRAKAVIAACLFVFIVALLYS
jgi:hypothetical protein